MIQFVNVLISDIKLATFEQNLLTKFFHKSNEPYQNHRKVILSKTN